MNPHAVRLAIVAPALLATLAAPSRAVPPPPAPMMTMQGGQTLCSPRFAIRLGADESADQYATDHWVVNGPGWSLGLRTYAAADALGLRAMRGGERIRTAVIPGRGRVERHRLHEWPGGRSRGWAYWLRQGSGDPADYVVVASDQFRGTNADYPRLQRVLIGEERVSLCPHLSTGSNSQ